MARQQDRAVIDLVINGEQAKTTLKAVSLEVTRTRSALQKMKEADDPALYKARLAEYHKLIDGQRQMRQRIDDTTTAWGRFKKEAATVMTGVLGGNIATAGLQMLANLIPSTIDKTMKLKDAFADIEKATGLSTDGVKKLNKELKDIDTRTTNQELRDIAVAGGQLGVVNEQMVSFVKNADMAVVALGDEFQGGVEQVAKSLGGVAKLFKETRDMDIGEAISRIGSGMNELGAAGSATAPVIADFTARMGQLGALAPNLAQTAGYGAALQELGLSAEIAASGLGNILLTGANQSELFAQHLGKTKEQIEQLINTDPDAFLKELAKSFQGLSQTQVVQRMKELKLESQESIKVMSLLADQTEFVEKKQALMAKAFGENTSLANEFAKKNHELARDLKNLNEWFNSLFTSDAVTNFIVSAAHNASEFIKVLPQITSWLGKNSEWFKIATIATVAYYVAVTRGTAAAVANAVAETYRKVAYEVGFRWLVMNTAAQGAYTTVMAATTIQSRIATAATLLWNGALTVLRTGWTSLTAVMLANPIGLAIAAIAGLVAAVKYFSENSERALKVEREKQKLQKELTGLTDKYAKAQEEINQKLNDYNNLSVTERANLEKTIALKLSEAQARLAAAKARAHENARQAEELSLWEQTKVWASNPFSTQQEFRRDMRRARLDKKDATFKDTFGEEGAELEAQVKLFQEQQKRYNELKNPAKTGSGKLNTITDPAEKKRAGDKAKADAKRDADELERMLGEARKNSQKAEETDYERSVQAFADKYSKMYELAKNNGAKIKEIETLSLVEWAAIEKAFYEKQDEERRKQEEKDNKTGFDSSLGFAELANTESKEQIGLDFANKKIGSEEAHLKELESDQAFLTQKLLLEQTFAQNSADTQRQLTENWNAQVQLRAQTERAATEEMKHAEWAMQDARRLAMSEGVSVLKGFLKENTIAYKAAIVAQKAFAIAQIIIDTQREISGLAASPATLLMPPGLREGYLIAKTVAAKVRAGIAIATIAATGFSEVAQKKDGGFTGIKELYGTPSGFVNSPTLFNQGRRSYIAGEAGREFVVSNRALQNPVVADFTRMLDVAQRSNNYSVMGAGVVSGGGGVVSAGGGVVSQPAVPNMVPLLMEIQALRQDVREQAAKPVLNNYHAWEQYHGDIQTVRNENTIRHSQAV